VREPSPAPVPPVAGAAGGWTESSLRAHLEAALAGRPRQTVDAPDRVPAAVLVLFVVRDGEPRLVFSKKTEAVPTHKGQFAFPGGVADRLDASRVETALREAGEEIGLDPGDVDVVGLFDDSPTVTSNFVITPVIGVARGTPAFRPDGREIERIIEVPLRELLDPGCYREEWWERDGQRRLVVFFTCGPDLVWGATGRILRDLLDAVFPA
jgi:8-oxo-dGTP pyrophosphatase MutT (NUDIX family)